MSEESHNRHRRLRCWVVRSLAAGAVLTAVVVVSGLLWGLLGMMRDAVGSAGARGVFLTAAVLWVLNFIALVVLTALCQLHQPSPDSCGGEE